jgi:hypothetical protein
MRPIAWLSMIGWIALGFVAARGADPVVRELPNKFDASDFPRWREHWAFRAMGHAAPPAVTRSDWVRNDVDRFVLARLEAQGLSPAAEADRLTLLRRASYGLTGLPPTRDEVDAFLADDAPDAWERQVDRLLASPHYGERMARHWLDLARYADSNGLDENLALGNAWRYRDWVVRSFNANESYDRFLTEQLAGDLLPEPADRAQLEDQLTATGFLVLGPKMLAEQDKQKLVMDVVDEQLDVTARTFLGLTAGCARCHDHKFDPLPTRDYYALAGIFKNTATMANLEFVSRWNQRELAPEAEIAARDAHLQRLETANRELAQREAAARDAVRKRWRADLARALVAATDAGASTRVIEAEDFARGNLHVDHEHWGTAEVGVIHTHVGGVQFAEYDVSMPHDGTWHVFARYAQGESRPIRVLADGAVVASSTLDAVTGGFMPEHQRVTRIGSVRWTAGAHVLRIERDSHFPHVDALVLVPDAVASADLTASLVRAAAAHLVLERRLANSPWSPWFAIAAARTSEACRDAVDAARAAAQDGPFTALLELPTPSSREEFAARIQAQIQVVDRAWDACMRADANATQIGDPQLDTARTAADRLFAADEASLDAAHDPNVATELATLRATRDELERTKPAPFARALAVREASTISDVAIHKRGSHLELEEQAVPRGAFGVFDHVVPPPVIPSAHSGRLELAQWMLHPEHPLTSRVFVNRLWTWQFGFGLVRQPSNFGLRTEPPTHPELLDWLARRFVASGYDVKAMLRLILTSSTYRMSSVVGDAAAQADPDNLRLARQFRRRLGAEEVRDGLLLLSGQLDRTAGGTLLTGTDGDYVTNDQSADAARYDVPRRSLYLPIIRNAMYDLFSTFDYADAGVHLECRPATVGAHQSLWMMNSPLVRDAARAVAAACASAPTNDSDVLRIERTWRAVLLRAPRPDEISRAQAFLERARAASPAGDAEGAWSGLAHVLFESNEFMHVD